MQWRWKRRADKRGERLCLGMMIHSRMGMTRVRTVEDRVKLNELNEMYKLLLRNMKMMLPCSQTMKNIDHLQILPKKDRKDEKEQSTMSNVHLNPKYFLTE